MEYKLNKIDTDLRNIINEQSKEGKIHSKHNVEVNSERLKDNSQKSNGQNKKDEKKPFIISKYEKEKKVIVVNAYKSESVEVSAEKEEDKNISSNKGLFIDTRK